MPEVHHENGFRYDPFHLQELGDEITLPMTQYLLPHGKAVPVQSCPIDARLKTRASAILSAGYRFECEMLRDYRTVSFTIHDPRKGEDVAGPVLAENGPDVPPAIEQLIENFRF